MYFWGIMLEKVDEKKRVLVGIFKKMKIYGLTFKKMYVNLFSSIKSNGYWTEVRMTRVQETGKGISPKRENVGGWS